MTVQFLELGGQKVAVLPIEDYVPSEVVDRLLGGETPLRVWRTYRIGKPAIWRKLSKSLKVDDDIVPNDDQ